MEPERVPVQTETSAQTVARLAKALGLAPEKVEVAIAKSGLSPAEAFTLILHGTDEARVAALAKELHVSRPRLALALLDSAVATQGVSARVQQAARGAAERAKDWAFEVGEFVLETFAETIPRILNRITLALVVTGLVLVGLGVLAFVDKAIFLLVAYYTMAVFLVAIGAALVWTAWKVHEATATLRTLARVARKWRARMHALQGRDDE